MPPELVKPPKPPPLLDPEPVPRPPPLLDPEPPDDELFLLPIGDVPPPEGLSVESGGSGCGLRVHAQTSATPRIAVAIHGCRRNGRPLIDPGRAYRLSAKKHARRLAFARTEQSIPDRQRFPEVDIDLRMMRVVVRAITAWSA
jgi:hypothetical protein